MKENYIKLVNACLPDALIAALQEKSGLEKKEVESICLEVIARVFGDGSDLSKENILLKLKNVISGEELKNILERLETKYQINPNGTSTVLEQLLPLLFKRITSLDDSYFDKKELEEENSESPVIEEKQEELVKEEVEDPIIEEIKREELTQEKSVDDVFKNIEEKAEAQFGQKPLTRKEKHRKPLFKKKEKPLKEVNNDIEEPESKELSLLEKICIWVIVASLLALIGTIVFLIVKQSL